MAWHAQLQLDYQQSGERTIARYQHTGPLRILQSLYPEGDRICHNVLVHPPGGLVGGDTLELNIQAAAHTHGLMTTPGATRFYKSEGASALQTTHIQLAQGARMEWLPLETICYSGCLAQNRLVMELAPDAELLGWDVCALGLPHAKQAFTQGRLDLHLEVPNVWLERGRLDASDTLLLNSPVGMAGHTCMASLFFVSGQAIARGRKEQALEAARTVLKTHPLASRAGVTSPNSRVLVVRVLAPVVEPAMQLLRQVRQVWRRALWDMEAVEPRIWSM